MDTIVNMTRFGTAPVTVALRQVEGYWHALRAGRDVPDRADIDPRGLEDALDVTFVAERIAPGVARMRIAGHHLCDLLGMEARGMTLNALFLPQMRETISQAINACCDTPAQVDLRLRSPGHMGQPELVSQLLLLPLRSDLGDVSRILGVVATQGQIGRTPRRFLVDGSTTTALSGRGPVYPTVDIQSVAQAAEAQRRFQPRRDTDSQKPAPQRVRPNMRASHVPHLRVVETD